ncbi:MAG: hypothetical protein ACKVT1_08490 [Dehalococcoidia bacterium]
MLAVLVRHGVDFIVVGGAGAIFHGSPQLTVDLDIVPEPGRENLDRLSAALTSLGARVRTAGVPDGLPFGHDGASLGRAAIWNLQTRFGDLDILSEPGGIGRYHDFEPRAIRVSARGLTIAVASLDDIIASKEAADRPKDHAALPGLHRLRAERSLQRTDSGEAPPPDRP